MSIETRLRKLEEVHSGGFCECWNNKWQIVDRTSDAPGGRQDPTPMKCETCGLMRRVCIVTDEQAPDLDLVFEGPIEWKGD